MRLRQPDRKGRGIRKKVGNWRNQERNRSEVNLVHTFGTAAWNTKSVMGIDSELVAITIMDTTLDGLAGTFSNAKSIFKPLPSNAVMDGNPVESE